MLARYDHSTARAATRSCVSLQCYLLRCDFFMALLSLLSIFLSFSLEPLYPGLAGFNGLHRAYFPLYPGALDSPDFVPRSRRAVPGRVLPPSVLTYGYCGSLGVQLCSFGGTCFVVVHVPPSVKACKWSVSVQGIGNGRCAAGCASEVRIWSSSIF